MGASLFLGGDKRDYACSTNKERNIMKKYKKSSMKFILLLAILFLGMSSVQASNYNGVIYEGEEIEGIYFYKHRSDTADTQYETHHFHEPARFFRRSSDNAYVYCIQSWNTLTGAKQGDYQESTSYTHRLTQEQLSTISLLGYYGYGYNEKGINHTDPKWYAITQYLIWQVEAPSIEHYFVSSLTSKTPIYPFNQEIKELKTLVEKHQIMPNFNKTKVDMVKGESLTFSDANEVFNTCTFRASTGITTSRRGNTLSIFANRVGKHTITIEKTPKRFTHNNVYYTSDDYQDAVLIGNFSTSKMTIDVSVMAGSASVIKTGEKLVGFENNHFTYVDEPLSDVTLELFAEKDIVNNTNFLFYHKDEKIASLTTGVKNVFEELYPGNYYILEKTNKGGYVVDQEKHSFSITKKQLDVEVIIKNKYQDVSVEFDKYEEHFKVEDNEPTFAYDLEENIVFGLYANQTIKSETRDEILFLKDDFILKVKSDKRGHVFIDADLPYGSYYIRELTKKAGYFPFDEKREFLVSLEGNQSTRKVELPSVYNTLKKTNFKLKKYSNTSSQAMENVEFGFYDEAFTLLFTKRTNEEGNISLVFPLKNFYVRELTTHENYILDEQSYLLNFMEGKDFVLQLFNHEKRVVPEIKDETNPQTPIDKKDELEDSIGGNVLPEDNVNFYLPVPKTDAYSYFPFYLLFVIFLSIGLLYEKE